MLTHIDNVNFKEEVLHSKELVMVDMWASWCSPCRLLSPILESLQEKNVGKVKIVKLNVDELQEYAVRYNVSSIPALLFFKEGKVIDRSVGFVSEKTLQEMIDKNL